MASYALHASVGVGTCCCHSNPTCIGVSGIVISSVGTSFMENRGNARFADVFVASCGHTSVMVTSSPTVFIEGKAACRIGDVFAGCISGVLVGNGSATGMTP